MVLGSGDTDYGLNIRLLLYIRQAMNTLPEDIQDTIYKYKHHLEFKSVIHEIHDIVCYWCVDQLTYRYCKGRHQIMYDYCKNELNTLNDYEEHLLINLKSKTILDMINDNYDVCKEWE